MAKKTSCKILVSKAGTLMNPIIFLKHFPKLKKYANTKILEEKINAVEDFYYKPEETIKLINEKKEIKKKK